jgi:hypothetical protein
LPFAKIKTHDKGEKSFVPSVLTGNGHWKKIVCRALYKKRTPNLFYHAFFLPCGLYKTHDKESFCRAPERKCTAKISRTAKGSFPVASKGRVRCAGTEAARGAEGAPAPLLPA